MANIWTKVKNIFSSLKTSISNFSFKTFYYDCFKMPLYLITHPLRGFDEFKREKTSKGYVAWFYLVMMIIAQIIIYNGSGFLINKNRPQDFNLLLTIALVIFPVVLGTIANWASTALLDGKGTMNEIFRVICYSFFPYVWLALIATIFSNVMTLDEVVFYQFFMGLGVGLTVYMMFFGLMGIHEFGLLKNIFMIIFTIVAIAVVLFIMILFLSLIQKFYSFISSVYEEFVRRFLCIMKL